MRQIASAASCATHEELLSAVLAIALRPASRDQGTGCLPHVGDLRELATACALHPA